MNTTPNQAPGTPRRPMTREILLEMIRANMLRYADQLESISRFHWTLPEMEGYLPAFTLSDSQRAEGIAFARAMRRKYQGEAWKHEHENRSANRAA
jgi:hypothetical protein